MSQHEIIDYLNSKFPQIIFKESDSDYWSSLDNTVYYKADNADDTDESSTATILHETSHGILRHKKYTSDFHLIQMEIEAWAHAKILAKDLKKNIDNGHIEDCLDSYRDCQYKRSLCPSCNLGGVQTRANKYQCIFCRSTWQVSTERFCRPYRLIRKQR